ncbi:MAG: MlaD family protein [Sulfuricurvum sp.]|uniref:MlaD family protein n=1 Tax=Sulfuricurvum sp. TaxID=2025608 RepID=UPI0026284329|nr:MlaD family protein [Sulfuricurvum sp.]MDD2950354.1 MlaD family protein [Sulfuricurvum sp.]MDD5118408.1 MlaD family protein [Sulfuricurvum sp.]
MESRVNYTVVGVFVLILASALIAFAFWLGKYNQDEGNYHRYRVYIKESVSGLAPEAAVKFHGVDVGMVESIKINPRNSEEVELTLKIKKETPIKTDSSAVLKFYGITGLAFIEIVGGSKDAPLLTTSTNAIATIPTSPSLITRLDESLSKVASKLSVTLDRADQLFSDKNVQNVAQTLDHLRSLTAQIDAYQVQVKQLLEQSLVLETNATESMASMKEAAVSVKTSSGNFNTLIQTKMTTTLESLQATSEESHTLIRKLEASLDRGDYDVRAIAAPASSELSDLIDQTRSLTNEMELTLRNLRESPSDLLFKKSTPKPGPGE